MDNAVLKIYKQRLLQQFTFKESKQIAERLAAAKDILRTQELKNNVLYPPITIKCSGF